MLRGDWRKLGKGVGLGVAVLLAVAVLSVAWLYSYHEFYKPAEQNHAAERYQPARDAANPVAGAEYEPPAAAYYPDCKKPKKYEDADLCAQWSAVQQVAETNRLTRTALKLGYIGFWVAFFGGLIGIVGTAYLVKTFRENRRAANAAHDANRPWLEIKVGPESRISLDGDEATLDCEVTLINRGNSPATCVHVWAQMYGQRAEAGGLIVGFATSQMDVYLGFFSGILGKDSGQIVFPSTESTKEVYRPHLRWDEVRRGRESGSIYVSLAVGVAYQFPGGEGRTIVSFDVIPDRKELRPFSIPAENITEVKKVRLDDNFASHAR